MTPNEIAVKVKHKAIELGFHLVGISKPSKPKSFEDYQSWVDNKYHGEMGYLANEHALSRRQDPLKVLVECKSVLSLGISYSKPKPDYKNPIIAGVGIASYAWNLDYHDVLKPRILELIKFIEEIIGKEIPYKWYTDTGPILERDLANQAGLGWVGKNSMLINPTIGSTFLLAEILLGIELPSNPKIITDHCGKCTRCIDACPTQCILPNRTIDARKCISYLTIEKKGDIPISQRESNGIWAFGCDVCQQVCPWNIKFSPNQGDQYFERKSNSKINPSDLFSYTPEEFNSFFKGSPIKRAKRRGLLRNMAVVLGNRGDVEDIPALIEALSHDEPLVRAHVAWALGKFDSLECKIALKYQLEIELDEKVRNEILISLSKK